MACFWGKKSQRKSFPVFICHNRFYSRMPPINHGCFWSNCFARSNRQDWMFNHFFYGLPSDVFPSKTPTYQRKEMCKDSRLVKCFFLQESQCSRFLAKLLVALFMLQNARQIQVSGSLKSAQFATTWLNIIEHDILSRGFVQNEQQLSFICSLPPK